MPRDVIEVRVLRGYTVHLRFDDGVAGDLDLSEMLVFDGVFAPLRDISEFAKVRVNRDLGTIVWPNGADLDPQVLYDALRAASGTPDSTTV
jgi:hypothetical protein